MEDGKLSRGAMLAITVLRVFIGWHFLYEGIAKLTATSWSGAGYLKQARGPFAEWFRLVFSPINLHSYFLMATAQLYMQGKLALGLPIAHTPVTRK